MKKKNRKVIKYFIMLGVIITGCVFADVIAVKEPYYMDLTKCTQSPGREFLFGTDTMGRDIFSGIWHGGRVSISIGIISAVLSTLVALVYGSISAMSCRVIDTMMMRFIEILLSIPQLLVLVSLQAALGDASVLSLSVVIAMTSWYEMAKIIQTEVTSLKKSGYVVASRSMDAGFFHILRYHLIPNLMPSIMFMAVMNIRSAIIMESTLSFMGIGLPLDIISWGSMLSQAQESLMTGAWWIILFPGIFIVAFIICITSIGGWLQER